MLFGQVVAEDCTRRYISPKMACMLCTSRIGIKYRARAVLYGGVLGEQTADGESFLVSMLAPTGVLHL